MLDVNKIGGNALESAETGPGEGLVSQISIMLLTQYSPFSQMIMMEVFVTVVLMWKRLFFQDYQYEKSTPRGMAIMGSSFHIIFRNAVVFGLSIAETGESFAYLERYVYLCEAHKSFCSFGSKVQDSVGTSIKHCSSPVSMRGSSFEYNLLLS